MANHQSTLNCSVVCRTGDGQRLHRVCHALQPKHRRSRPAEMTTAWRSRMKICRSCGRFYFTFGQEPPLRWSRESLWLAVAAVRCGVPSTMQRVLSFESWVLFVSYFLSNSTDWELCVGGFHYVPSGELGFGSRAYLLLSREQFVVIWNRTETTARSFAKKLNEKRYQRIYWPKPCQYELPLITHATFSSHRSSSHFYGWRQGFYNFLSGVT